MASSDYIKFITEQLVQYLDASKEERMEKKKKRKSEQAPMLYRLFGLLPFAFMFTMKKKKKGRKKL